MERRDETGTSSRMSSAKTPPRKALSPTACAPIARMRAHGTDGRHGGDNSVHVAGEALLKRTQTLRQDLRDLRTHVHETLQTACQQQADAIVAALNRLRIGYPAEARRQVRQRLSALRQDSEGIKQCVIETRRALDNDVRTLTTQLSAIAADAPRVNEAERLAVRGLHAAIADLIRESDVGAALEREHQNAVQSANMQQREAQHRLVQRVGSRIAADALAPAVDHQRLAGTLAKREHSPPSRAPAGAMAVDETLLPPPDDVMTAMFGPRTWKLHSRSLLDAVPYATSALTALRLAMRQNTQTRDLLQLRITRQAKEIDDLQERSRNVDRIVSAHVTQLRKVMARVSNGQILGRAEAPEAVDARQGPDQLRAVSDVVVHFIDHMAHVAERYRIAAERGVTVDIPSPTMGVTASGRERETMSRGEAAKAALFPPAEKHAALVGQIALLRRKLCAARWRHALQIWRFRRCATALVARHDRLSAQEATDAQNAAYHDAMVSFQQAEGTGDSLPSPDRKQSSAAALPRVLPFIDARARLESSSILPPAGADPMLFARHQEVEAYDYSFDRRAEEALESWRTRKAKAAERTRAMESTDAASAKDASKLLLELHGGHDTRPNVFSALPPAPTSPRYQRSTRVSAEKQRLRPISQPGAYRSSAFSAALPIVLHPRPPTSALASAPISNALDVFLRATRPQTM
jgi:hypothetical protein